jgi:hypothetical protein
MEYGYTNSNLGECVMKLSNKAISTIFNLLQDIESEQVKIVDSHHILVDITKRISLVYRTDIFEGIHIAIDGNRVELSESEHSIFHNYMKYKSKKFNFMATSEIEHYVKSRVRYINKDIELIDMDDWSTK